jgi:hypothetical protein
VDGKVVCTVGKHIRAYITSRQHPQHEWTQQSVQRLTVFGDNPEALVLEIPSIHICTGVDWILDLRQTSQQSSGIIHD